MWSWKRSCLSIDTPSSFKQSVDTTTITTTSVSITILILLPGLLPSRRNICSVRIWGKCSLRGRRLEGEGKGVLGARETRGPGRTRRKGTSFPPSSRSPRVSLAPKTPFPFPFKRLRRRLGKVYVTVHTLLWFALKTPQHGITYHQKPILAATLCSYF